MMSWRNLQKDTLIRVSSGPKSRPFCRAKLTICTKETSCLRGRCKNHMQKWEYFSLNWSMLTKNMELKKLKMMKIKFRDILMNSWIWWLRSLSKIRNKMKGYLRNFKERSGHWNSFKNNSISSRRNWREDNLPLLQKNKSSPKWGK